MSAAPTVTSAADSSTCDLSFLDGEGNDQAEGPQHRFHPIDGADGVIGSLNQNQKGVGLQTEQTASC